MKMYVCAVKTEKVRWKGENADGQNSDEDATVERKESLAVN